MRHNENMSSIQFINNLQLLSILNQTGALMYIKSIFCESFKQNLIMDTNKLFNEFVMNRYDSHVVKMPQSGWCPQPLTRRIKLWKMLRCSPRNFCKLSCLLLLFTSSHVHRNLTAQESTVHLWLLECGNLWIHSNAWTEWWRWSLAAQCWASCYFLNESNDVWVPWRWCVAWGTTKFFLTLCISEITQWTFTCQCCDLNWKFRNEMNDAIMVAVWKR